MTIRVSLELVVPEVRTWVWGWLAGIEYALEVCVIAGGVPSAGTEFSSFMRCSVYALLRLCAAPALTCGAIECPFDFAQGWLGFATEEPVALPVFESRSCAGRFVTSNSLHHKSNPRALDRAGPHGSLCL